MVAIIYHNMVYQDTLKKPFILASGTHKGYYFWVVTYGTHPCAYVEIPETHPFYKKDFDELFDKLDVHGGVSFAHFGLLDLIPNDVFIVGWDYSHCTDYNYKYNTNRDADQWTVEYIIEEIYYAINQLIDVKEQANE